MSFRINGLPAHRLFRLLFALSDAELAAGGAARPVTNAREPSYPCRVSHTDSKPGGEPVLINDEQHPVVSPYRMRFVSYLRQGEQTFGKVDAVPAQLRMRVLTVRGFDANATMVGWELVEGSDLEAAIERQFAEPRAAYLHIHFAAAGRYAARVERT